MRTQIALAVVGVAVIGLAAGMYLRGGGGNHVRSAVVPAVLATPVGITLQVSGSSAAMAYGPVKLQTVYGDAKGMSLYTYDKDVTPGQSSCTGDCAKGWPPAAAASDAKPSGDWTLVARDDGAKQWAYKGKPLYAFAKDTKPGEIKGDGVGESWHVASFKPADGVALPYGVAIREVVDSNGQVLVDGNGMTLYAFEGDPAHDRATCATPPCADHWTPLAAAALANPIGEWTLIERDDGIKQWAFRGKPLYSFDGDLQPGDANGAGTDDRWHVAMLTRYFLPPNASIQRTAGRGTVFATAEGLTLYRRDAHNFRSGGHSPRTSLNYRPDVGREIGTKGCVADCLQTWHPFVAPADAQPSGYWEVVTGEGGVRQWSYMGFALYTYGGDKKPGDMNGNDIFDIGVVDGVHQVAQVGPAQVDAYALFWHNAEP